MILTIQAKQVLIDDEDIERINMVLCENCRWHINHKYDKVVGWCFINGLKAKVFLHKVILNYWGDLDIDHIDGNGLNNQKSNLRICSHAQNCFNQGLKSSNTSGYKGVRWKSDKIMWCAEIRVNGKKKFLGHFLHKKEAAVAYNNAALLYHGEFAETNLL